MVFKLYSSSSAIRFKVSLKCPCRAVRLLQVRNLSYDERFLTVYFTPRTKNSIDLYPSAIALWKIETAKHLQRTIRNPPASSVTCVCSYEGDTRDYGWCRWIKKSEKCLKKLETRKRLKNIPLNRWKWMVFKHAFKRQMGRPPLVS